CVSGAESVREVEAETLGQPDGLSHRSWMLEKASGHRLWRGENMAEVAAPLRLRSVERRTQPHGHERILKRRTLARVRVHISCRDTRHSELLPELCEAPVARPI